jgi:hypothetical protein
MKAGSVAGLVKMSAKLGPSQADQMGAKAFHRDPIEELL